jgi:alpha-D-xyloside xylohydrolase
MLMEGSFEVKGQEIFWHCDGEMLHLQPWGADGIRVQATPLVEFPAIPNALLDAPLGTASQIDLTERGANLTNGKIRVEISKEGQLRFFNTQSGKMLLGEPAPYFNKPPARWWRFEHGDLARLVVRFEPNPGERFYGLGQHQHGKLDQKGCVIELEQRNTEVCIPFLLSSHGYAFLWNNPGIGQVELAENITRWVADGTRLMDYYIVAGDSYAELLDRYTHATGRAPLLPEWALGFWQCKLRYRTQEELLEVAREYHRRGIPLSVIVTDFFHWSQMGDWQFDSRFWPDPAAMVQELSEMGMRLMVSIWPTVNPNNADYDRMRRDNLLVRTERGLQTQTWLWDTTPPGKTAICYYDSTHPAAREFVWSKIRKNYYDLGVRVYWLDADEPEIYPMHPGNLRYALGNGLEVANIYPLLHQKGFWENLRPAKDTDEDILALSRSAWAGSQRYGAAVWSGDIPSTFEALQTQVRAGLNIGLSGIPWWTTDIGGFTGGNIQDPAFRELLVRWFEYGTFCPLFRLHGHRLPVTDDSGAGNSGAANELWSFGEEAYEILCKLVFIRERLKPYLIEQARQASAKGTPVMRPLFFDFAHDPVTETVDDSFMLGPDLLVAPVLEAGQRQRRVYLPAGADWQDAWTGNSLPGGQWIEADAPIERIPIYWRATSSFKSVFS